MMSLSSTLDYLQRAISSQSNETAEKIERLKQAKREISREQEQLLQEIKKIKQPYLEKVWIGKRANEYDRDREDAYSVMKQIGQSEYSNYQQSIESKINSLEMQQGILAISRAIANEADQLVDKGEDAIDDLTNKISELKGRLL